jgi:hypothetical protein
VDWAAAAREHADRPGTLADPPPDGSVAALLLAPAPAPRPVAAAAPTGDGPADVPLELWAAVTVGLQTAGIPPAEYDAYAQTRGVPAGRWAAADAEWNRLMRSDWLAGARIGEALEAARRR